MTAEGSCALVLVDVVGVVPTSLCPCQSYPVHLAYTAAQVAAVAIRPVHRIYSSEVAVAAATEHVVAGGAVEEVVWNIDLVVSEAWIVAVHRAWAVLEEAVEVGSAVRERTKRQVSPVLRVAIQQVVEGLAGELAAPALYTVAAVASIAQAALWRRRLARLLGSRKEWIYPNTVPTVRDMDGRPCHLCSHAVLDAMPYPETA